MRIAVLVPCFNEEAAIGRVVADFRAHLPTASVFVYDNNSTDRTREAAAAAGAVVRGEARRGKGDVVRRKSADVDADVYVPVDGDATYDASAASRMVEALLADHLDMVVAAREEADVAAYRAGRRFGDLALTGAVSAPVGDMPSGYRAFSRRFVRFFPALSTGFEIETEFTVHALTPPMPTAKVRAPYAARPEGSASKLDAVRDGLRIGAPSSPCCGANGPCLPSARRGRAAAGRRPRRARGADAPAHGTGAAAAQLHPQSPPWRCSPASASAWR